MFLDIRNFSARAASAEQKNVINFLNCFLEAMVAIIENDHGWTVNKFLGARVLLSRLTRTSLADTTQLRALPPQEIKGIEGTVDIFTISKANAERK